MAILKEQLATRTKGPMAENEDWWYLCYDTDADEFFVEHEWSYVKINGLTSDNGTAREDVTTWRGQGADQIEAAKERLLRRASE